MSDFDPKECERLAGEMAEDDIAVSGDNYNAWMDASQRLRNNAHAASEQLRAACAEVEGLRAKVSDMRSEAVRAVQNHVDSQAAGAQERIARREAEADRDRLAAELQAVKDERDGLHRTLKAVVDFAIDECGMPTRDMLGSDAPVRVMRKLKQDRDSYANSDFERQLDEARGDRDRLAAEVERLTKERDAALAQASDTVRRAGVADARWTQRLDEELRVQALAWSEKLKREVDQWKANHEQRKQERDRLTANLAALTSDLARYRALVEQMRPVYEAALRWRRCDRDLVGPCVDHRDLVEACANACDVVLDTAAPKGAEDE